MAAIPQIRCGDVLELKKPHPCGEKRFTVLRVGTEIRVVCCGCGRDMVIDRVRLEKAIRKIDRTGEEAPPPTEA